VVAYLTLLAIACLLVGLIRKRYYRLCYSLFAYLIAVVICDSLILVWPGRFYTWTFWNAKESLFVALKLAVAMELASVVFQAFPGARATARLAIGVGLVAIVVLVLVAAQGPAQTVARHLQPRLANATAVLFASLWGLAIYYNLPLHQWHAAILRGFVPYLLVFTIALRLTVSLGWQARPWASLADTCAYLAMLLYWFMELLRPEPPPPADPEVVTRLQPWRARLAR
jgi:hypothetical protein